MNSSIESSTTTFNNATFTVVAYTTACNIQSLGTTYNMWREIDDIDNVGIYYNSSSITGLRYVYYCTFRSIYSVPYIYNEGFLTSTSSYAIIPECLYCYMPDSLYQYRTALGTGTTDDVIKAIQDQTDAQQEFYDVFLSTDYDEEQASSTISSATSSFDDVDDSDTKGLFTTIFDRLSACISGDYESVETITVDVMGKGSMTISSDILSNMLDGSILYTLLQASWMFIFGLYLFKFVNNLYNKIKSGDILNGYENNDEVITSTML